MKSTKLGHWSDCAVYNAPADLPGPCDCGGLDLAAYERYVLITSLIPCPRSLARFVEHGILPSAVETEQSPRQSLSALAPTADLPSPHNGIAVGGGSNGVDLNNAGIAAVSDGKALSGVQSITSNVPPHTNPPDSVSGDRSTVDSEPNA